MIRDLAVPDDLLDARHRRRVVRILAKMVVLCAALVGAGCTTIGNAPPLHEVEPDLPGGVTEERALFGLVEEVRSEGGALGAAIRPFIVEWRGPTGAHVREFLPPIAAQTVSDIRRRLTIWPLFASDSVGNQSERVRGLTDDDTTILPFVGWGSEPDQGDWWMAFPLAGHLRQKLFADEIDFYAFPLYARTRAGDWHSTHLLWPLVAWGSGPGRHHFRALPFWSESDTPDLRKRTALWPFLHWSVERRGDRTFDGWFAFPFAGHRTTRDGTFEEWTALWPLFEWSDDAKNGDRHRAILWPFHKELERPADHTSSTWWWPFYGNYRSDTETSDWYAWPVVWTAEFRDEKRTFRRTFVVPLWMDREDGPPGAPADHRELRSWPLFSFERTPAGVETLRVPEIIPFFGWRSGETAWADLVTLFRWRADAEGRAAWDGPLGGIVRWRRTLSGESKLTLLWWLDIPTGDGS